MLSLFRKPLLFAPNDCLYQRDGDTITCYRIINALEEFLENVYLCDRFVIGRNQWFIDKMHIGENTLVNTLPMSIDAFDKSFSLIRKNINELRGILINEPFLPAKAKVCNGDCYIQEDQPVYKIFKVKEDNQGDYVNVEKYVLFPEFIAHVDSLPYFKESELLACKRVNPLTWEKIEKMYSFAFVACKNLIVSTR